MTATIGQGDPAGRAEALSAQADPAGRDAGPAPDIRLRRWNSSQWRAVRGAVYYTLEDMTVFPALARARAPLPNALRQSAVGAGLIDPVTSWPTERLLRLNPGLRGPRVPA